MYLAVFLQHPALIDERKMINKEVIGCNFLTSLCYLKLVQNFLVCSLID